jgi:hypothetical protein
MGKLLGGEAFTVGNVAGAPGSGLDPANLVPGLVVTIQNDPITNVAVRFWGHTTPTDTDGFVLQPGDTMTFDCGADLAKLLFVRIGGVNGKLNILYEATA